MRKMVKLLLSGMIAVSAAAMSCGALLAQMLPVKTVYGHSVDGRPLAGYKFGTGPNTTLIMASTHGNERNTRPMAERLISYLQAKPDAYAGCTVWVIPCVNPDGWASNSRVNAHAVDLNRNFPVNWHPNVPGKLRRGSAPLSEPESAALAKIVEALRPQKIVSIHNPLHMLDYTGAPGLALAKVISAQDGYPIPTGGVGYPTPGSFGDFAAKQIGCAIVTLELPREPVDEAWSQNKSALLAAIKYNLRQ